jgi:phage shock protein PspC (stress-responsive transcriptional regulator)
VLFGVCGGLAEYFGIDPTLVRIGVVLLTLFPPTMAVGLLGYIALALLLPDEGSEHLSGRDRLQQNLSGLRADASDLSDTVRSSLGRSPRARPMVHDDFGPAAPTEDTINRAAEEAVPHGPR